MINIYRRVAMLDSYQYLLERLNIDKDKFFEHGLKEIIYVDDDKIKAEWEALKRKIENNEEVFIRGYGRDAKGTKYYIEFYTDVFNNHNIKKDVTNNAKPKAIIEKLTGKIRIRNNRCIK